MNRIQWKETRDNRKRDGVSVLDAMLVTAAVFHFERSALNAAAEENAVGGCRYREDETSKKVKSE